MAHNRPPSPLVDKPSLPNRKRSPSPKSIYKKRPPSPSLDPHTESEMNKVKKAIPKAMKARLYLLQQVGPLSFLIGGDSPEHKYRVTIGRQTCSCGKGQFCTHLLFVMLRVFQLKENDPLLWSKELKNYEVETLFRHYHKRIAQLLKKNRPPVTDGRRKGSPTPESVSKAAVINAANVKEEDETCPICLLEMVEGESLTICREGCQNRLHHHCMSIWAQECKRRKEPLICPLCRTVWKKNKRPLSSGPAIGNDVTSSSSISSTPSPSPGVPAAASCQSPLVFQPESRSRSESPLNVPVVHEDVGLPRGQTIPENVKEMTQPWVEIFGQDMVACLFSRDWKNRETALKYMSRKVTKVLSGRRTTSSFRQTRWEVLDVCCSVLKHMSTDPVYNVYVGALRTFRAILGLVRCEREEDLHTLHDLAKPILENIILKCADSNRRVSIVSLKVLQEFIKWDIDSAAPQARTIGCTCIDFCLDLLDKCDRQGDSTWQFLLGCVVFLQKTLDDNLELIVDVHEDQLDYAKPISLDSEFDMSDFLDSLEQKVDPVSQEPLFGVEANDRLRKIIKFCACTVNARHKKVSKMALTILIRTTQIASRDHEAFSNVKPFLRNLKPSIQNILQRQLSSDRLRASANVNTLDDFDDIGLDLEEGELPRQTSEEVLSPPPSYNSCMKESRQGMHTPPSSPKSASSNSSPENASPPKTQEIKVRYAPKCEQIIAEEEAEALAMALNISLNKLQDVIPHELVCDGDEDVLIHVQPEEPKTVAGKHVYLESVHWKKGGLLGTGAYSSCYEVRDLKTGRLMAVKQVSICRNSIKEQERVQQTVLDEITLMHKLRHPHIVQCLGATQHTGHFNIFMEIMPGGSISRLLSRFGPFQNDVIKKYCRQILMAVAYLHEKNCLHRDIKGANILVDSTGQVVKLSDFGTAAQLLACGTGTHEFTGQLLGTIAFMAPEVIRGETYGRKCDIWSIGCVIIEMSTGTPPWEADVVSNHLALMYKIASATRAPPIPDNLDPGLKDVVLRCLEAKDSDRPSALDLLKHAFFRM